MEKDNYFRNKVTYYSFILCIFVVFTHALNMKTYNLLNDMGKLGRLVYWIETYMYNVFTVAVPAFFILSGYLFYRNFKIQDYTLKLKKRVKSLLIPFIIWNSIGFMFFKIVYSIPFISSKMNGEIIGFSIENYIYALINSTYSALWFVKVLMIMVIISPIIYLIIKKIYIGIFTIIILLIINYIAPTNEFSFIYSSIFYLTGALAGLHFKNNVEYKSNKKVSIICKIIFIILSIIFTLTGATEIQKVRALILLAFAIVAWFGFDNIIKINNPKWWMKMSFLIYCSHYILLESIEKVWLIIFKNTAIGALTDFIFAPSITIIVILFIGKKLKEEFPEIFSVITGNRG